MVVDVKEKTYKCVEVKAGSKFSDEDLNGIVDLFSRFYPYAYCDLSETSDLRVFLNQIDFSELKQIALEFKLNQNGNGSSSLIDEVVEAVDSIRSFGLKGGKRVYIGYNDERKVQNRKKKVLKRTSTMKENVAGVSQQNKLPSEYENKIICGDSLEVLKLLPDNCVDVMITSPPYNFGLEYDKGEDDKQWEKYFQSLFAILDETHRVLKSGGRMIVNIQPLFSDYIPTHHIISKHLLDIGMLWKGEIIWEKNNYNCKYTSWGSWKSPSSPYLKYTWEFLEIFCKENLKHDGDSDNIDITADEFKKWVIAKWSMAPERKMKKYQHPAMFPEELVIRCLKLFSFKGDTILDVFNGAGTTTSVAGMLGRKYLGIDISPEYCAIAKERVSRRLF